MSAAQSEAVIDRLAATRTDLGAVDFGAYAFLVLGILGYHAPDVLAFILDRADERLLAGAASAVGDAHDASEATAEAGR